jgi:hypothetical protein
MGKIKDTLNIAIENGPFIDGLPGFTVLKNGDFPWLCWS